MLGVLFLLFLFFYNVLIPPDGTFDMRLSAGGYKKQKRVGVWKSTNDTTCQICLTPLIFPEENNIVPDGDQHAVATEISQELYGFNFFLIFFGEILFLFLAKSETSTSNGFISSINPSIRCRRCH